MTANEIYANIFCMSKKKQAQKQKTEPVKAPEPTKETNPSEVIKAPELRIIEAPCKIVGMSNEEYHSRKDFIGSSDLKSFRKNGEHYYYKVLSGKYEFEETDSVRLGKTVHTRLFDGEEVFKATYAVGPNSRKGSKAWLEFEANNPGKTLINEEIFEKSEKIIEKLKADPVAGLILNEPAENEVSYFWVEKVNFADKDGNLVTVNVPCKCRPDTLLKKSLIFDLKTTITASPLIKEFPTQCNNLGYHISHKHYCQGIKAVDNVDPAFMYLAIETDEPYSLSAFEPNEKFLRAADIEWRLLMQRHAMALYYGTYKSYGEGIIELDFPKYTLSELEQSAIKEGIEI